MITHIIQIHPVTRDNWVQALQISLHENQKLLVPSITEGLAYAYIKPWDEAFDPYVLQIEGKIMGFFYISYTPESTDNYWIGGFQIDKTFQGQGMGKRALRAIIDFINYKHPLCQIISLTVERDNHIAQHLYTSMSFISENLTNSDDEVIYRLKIR
ncbi:GNAT family N-acetyltransferase [Paenibacillus xylanexedens]|uniref:GNAT family N-acetyltransferase n=1 Tax=Paenibacillus xylanexedens TaxID=528191 RepID=UPI00119FAD96|nr:GNAT family N-acetyltransferase [Paenibacillus xylanexedens]